jgi:gluconate transporter
VCYTGKDKSKTAAQYEHCDEILKEKTEHLGIHVTREDIIHSFDNAKGTNGSIAMPGISELSPLYLACVTAAIAGASTVCSHFNDSGFWLVKSLVGMDEKTTLKTWTIMETLVGGVGFLVALVISFFA